MSKVLSRADLSSRLREAGYRVTPQRLHVYESLAHSGEHLTPDGVLDAVRIQHPSISLNTVYEVLETLTAVGAIRRADIGAGSRRYDANMEPHHHVVCRKCGRQEDVACDAFGDTCGGDAVRFKRAGLVAGIEIDEAQVIFFGVCAECSTVNSRVNKTDSRPAAV